MNRVTKNIEKGLDRIHGICSLMAATRHRLKHGNGGYEEVPGAKMGKCLTVTMNGDPADTK